MVTTTDTTRILTQPKVAEPVRPSLKRWLKHFFYLPLSKRYFSSRDQQEIAQAVHKAEQGHVGEIQVVIEGHIPCHQAYWQNTQMRARQLFAELGVWDTQFNSGVLLYVNLCEQKVEIVVDRGICHATEQQVWNEICQAMIALFQQHQYCDAVIWGVESIGKELNFYYANSVTDHTNELDNAPIVMK